MTMLELWGTSALSKRHKSQADVCDILGLFVVCGEFFLASCFVNTAAIGKKRRSAADSPTPKASHANNDLGAMR